MKKALCLIIAVFMCLCVGFGCSNQGEWRILTSYTDCHEQSVSASSKQEHSLEFLNSVLEGVNPIMVEYGIWFTTVCEECNNVIICLEDESQIIKIVENLKSKNLYKKNSLSFYVGENSITLN